MLDLLYVSFNRLAYTRESFESLLRNTDWENVSTLFVLDDASTDGTAEWLQSRIDEWLRQDGGVETVFYGDRFGGPVAAINWYLDHADPDEDRTDRFAKIDNDMVVPPGWLPELLRILTAHPELDIVGMEPMLGPPEPAPFARRTLREARHIGGKGIIRRRTFEGCRPRPRGKNGYFGFTEWQLRHPQITKAWATPDLPAFGLDQLPLEPWRSLRAEYVAKGWQREWGEYPDDFSGYWEWWTPVYNEVAV